MGGFPLRFPRNSLSSSRSTVPSRLQCLGCMRHPRTACLRPFSDLRQLVEMSSYTGNSTCHRDATPKGRHSNPWNPAGVTSWVLTDGVAPSSEPHFGLHRPLPMPPKHIFPISPHFQGRGVKGKEPVAIVLMHSKCKRSPLTISGSISRKMGQNHSVYFSPDDSARTQHNLQSSY